MASSFSFLHTADLHIDTAFSGFASANEDLAARLGAATRRAFSAIVDRAISESVDFVIIAGDVFDSEYPNVGAQLFVSRELERLAAQNIHVYMVAGNHDPLGSWSSAVAFPDTVHWFPSAGVHTYPVERKGELIAEISGVSFGERDVAENLSLRFRELRPASFSIGVLHCNVGGKSHHGVYAPCSLGDLKACPVDYWALGHIHMREILSADAPAVVYPGNPQGRFITESGIRGCVLVNVGADKKIQIQEMHTSDVVFFQREFSIAGLDSWQELEEALSTIEESSAQGTVLRIVLTGSGPLERDLRRPEVLRDLRTRLNEGVVDFSRPFLWFDSLVFRPEILSELERLRVGEDFVEMLHVKFADLRVDQKQALELAEQILKPLDRYRRRLDPAKASLSAAQVTDIIEQAQSLCSGLLAQERSLED